VSSEPHNGSAPECSCETDVEQQEVKSIMMNTEKNGANTG